MKTMHAEGVQIDAAVFGAGEESRTPDLRITNALLYQLSYTGEADIVTRWQPLAKT